MRRRKFEILRVFLSPILSRFRYAKKTAEWRRMNTHNLTTVNEWCPIDKVEVGKNTYGQLNVHWYGQEEEKLKIGHYCSIAGDVHFVLGGEHNYKKVSTYPFSEKIFHEKKDGICRGPIIIGDDVWIGFGAIILSGVTIGQGCVIGAGSVVTKNIDPYSIWTGNGIKKKRFSDTVITELMRIDYEKVEPERYRKYVELEITDENASTVVDYLQGDC